MQLIKASSKNKNGQVLQDCIILSQSYTTFSSFTLGMRYASLGIRVASLRIETSPKKRMIDDVTHNAPRHNTRIYITTARASQYSATRIALNA